MRVVVVALWLLLLRLVRCVDAGVPSAEPKSGDRTLAWPEIRTMKTNSPEVVQ